MVEDSRPFTLHFGYEDWQADTIRDRDTQPLPLGMHGVTLPAEELAGRHSLQFTRRYADGSWDPRDTQVTLAEASTAAPALRLPLAARGAASAVGPLQHPDEVESPRVP